MQTANWLYYLTTLPWIVNRILNYKGSTICFGLLYYSFSTLITQAYLPGNFFGKVIK